MKARFTAISAVVLAGGRSSRMGRHKAFITVNSKRIIDSIMEALKGLFGEIIIVTNEKPMFSEFENVILVEDLIKGCGPLGGIYTGLKTAINNKAFFAACDMPFLHNGLIERLSQAARQGDFDCVIPYTGKRIEPLHAVYHKRILSKLEASLNSGDLSIRGVLEQCHCKYVKAQEGEGESFFNLNTPEDVEWVEFYEGKIKGMA